MMENKEQSKIAYSLYLYISISHGKEMLISVDYILNDFIFLLILIKVLTLNRWDSQGLQKKMEIHQPKGERRRSNHHHYD